MDSIVIRKKDIWWIRNVDEDTRQRIRVYAVNNHLTIAQAITKLVEIALSK